MKILNSFKNSFKKMFTHDCTSCGMCMQNSVKIKWVAKEDGEKLKKREDD
ncbi:hypothetical protein [Methanobacterium paludis]|jgi:hypothetical protein|uniref:Uncharacterized protein n=1 Tax=Methanobacterium paludis (strain DSM 25820 / JCM 18151 / SWAN1) TaxID=868131 RepID=F6D7U5_METPW|nr:hypothetical protein [Methanobacterium paludis]AEG17783.1 hypothetical protein MSWAN_0750 [Methanobacterium paludis]